MPRFENIFNPSDIVEVEDNVAGFFRCSGWAEVKEIKNDVPTDNEQSDAPPKRKRGRQRKSG